MNHKPCFCVKNPSARYFLFFFSPSQERIQQRDSVAVAVVIVAFVIVAQVCVFVITLYVVVNGQKSPHQCGNQYSAVHSTVLNVCLGAFVCLSQNKVKKEEEEEENPRNGRKITRPFSGLIFFVWVCFVCSSVCIRTVIIAIFGHVREKTKNRANRTLSGGHFFGEPSCNPARNDVNDHDQDEGRPTHTSDEAVPEAKCPAKKTNLRRHRFGLPATAGAAAIGSIVPLRST